MHLLYVDDDRINLLLFEQSCAGIGGLQLTTAASGQEALALARQCKPDLLLLDLHLPDTNGYALLQALREESACPHAPAFLCTADDNAEVRHAAQAAGFAGCWTKPVDGQTLRRELAAFNPGHGSPAQYTARA
jgi:two-component system OmpR family response regulator